MELLMTMVGAGLYGHERFERESKRLGVQRAMQFYMLQNIKFGDPILLAEHVVDGKKEAAVGFGYFRVEGFVNQLPEEIKEKVHEKLHIISDIKPAGLQQRACGSYMDAGGWVVTDTLEQIVGYIKDACEELNQDPNKFKYLLRGSFVKLEDPAIIHSQRPFRGYKKVNLPDLVLARPSGKKKQVVNIYDYSRRMYFKKKERVAFDSTLLDEFTSKK